MKPEPLNRPKTNLQEILFELITKGNASIETFGYLCGFRTRISQLKRLYDLPLLSIPCTEKNKFGNTYTYHIHFLKNIDKRKAVNIYKKLQEKGKK